MSKRHIEYHIASITMAACFATTAGAVAAVGCSIFMPEYIIECTVGVTAIFGVSVFYIESFG